MNNGFEGLPEFVAKLKRMPEKVQMAAKGLVEDSAKQTVLDAVRNLGANGSEDLGSLRQSIDSLPEEGGLSRTIFVDSEYGHTIEWGTKGKVKVPAELASYAAQFKGMPSGGTWDEFLKAITAWVKRKGLTGVYSVKTRKRLMAKKYDNDAEDEGLAWYIARSIYVHGIQPKPFFYPAYFKNRDQLIEDLKNDFENWIINA